MKNRVKKAITPLKKRLGTNAASPSLPGIRRKRKPPRHKVGVRIFPAIRLAEKTVQGTTTAHHFPSLLLLVLLFQDPGCQGGGCCVLDSVGNTFIASSGGGRLFLGRLGVGAGPGCFLGGDDLRLPVGMLLALFGAGRLFQ